MHAAINDTCLASAADDEATRKSTSIAENDLTEQAQRLAAENLHCDLDDLLRPVSGLDRTKARPAEPLAKQLITHTAMQGLRVAEHRGLLCMVQDYQQQMLRWEKQRLRLAAAAQGRIVPPSPTTKEQAFMRQRHRLLGADEDKWLSMAGAM